ncbi:hypothetical protein C1X69_05910 [Pseudomonas sp. FW305-67]|nr:hypothetical protein C1X70_08195 [Pseudomonas sp. FW305-53]PMY84706.1 hypothetical protein C1X68_22730 [Pseudomonas sp. FW303-C2]PMY93430.1 hypothetical protein C1X67_07920 [Pseudomonas sp. FW305-62]PNA43454.1 hypothetical protein C1X71_12265 [Pseudomonas sp. FW306-2-2C-A10BC]PNA88187.1 hypothetical protein C1X66_05470 [Pseudomonas sp. MPR-R3B]PNB22970.1 hypothetical protein C1X69_05910 [Pseudomonas sp. FW305-67]
MGDCGVGVHPAATLTLWRGGLPPLGCAAAPTQATPTSQTKPTYRMTTAAQPSASKLPRHNSMSLH